MVAKSKHPHPRVSPRGTKPPMPPRGSPRALLIRALDALRVMPAPLRRYLQHFPTQFASPLPRPPRDRDIAALVDAGFLLAGGGTHCLTPLGRVASAEIHAAEEYVGAFTFD